MLIRLELGCGRTIEPVTYICPFCITPIRKLFRESFRHRRIYAAGDLVGRFLHDVYVVARLVDLVERFEVCEHVVLDVRAEHVAKKRREIFQRERVTRYRKMELPVNDTHVTVNRGYKSEF